MTGKGSRRARRGFTLVEVLTALVVIAVLTAIAVPTWRTHLLRARRGDGMAALIALQSAQDRYFGRNARYATAAQLAASPPAGLGLAENSARGFYRIELEATSDGLGYTATARVLPQEGQAADTRCVELGIDHNGIRRAQDADGVDRAADCWR